MKPLLPANWRWVSLGTILVRQRDLMNPSDFQNSRFNSVGLEDIGGDGTGEISAKQVQGGELVSAKAQFTSGDLLYGRLRPYLNKVAIAPSDGVCSTEIWVLQPTPVIETQFAFLMLTSDYMLKRIERVTEGANLPRVDADGFDRIEIPLPPLSEQRRIVEILNEAREIRRLRRQADDLTTKLIPAIFDDMFGSVLQDTEWTTLGEISDEVRYGTSKASADSGFITLRIPNVIGDTISYEDLVSVPLDTNEALRYTLKDGDLLFVRTNGNSEYIGRSGVFDSSIARRSRLDANSIIFASYLIRVRLKTGTLNPYFAAAYLRTPHGRADVMRQAKTSAGQFNINTEGLKSLAIPVFSYEMQSKFLEHVMQIEELKRSQYAESDSLLKQVHASLLAYAFSGELTAEWRKGNRELLAKQSEDRDLWLLNNGIKLTIVDEGTRDSRKKSDARLVELNREQRRLFEQIQNLDQNENGGTFTLTSLVKKLEEPLDSLSVDAVRRHLVVLASLGLIKAISQRAGGGGSVGLAFGNVYRLPRTAKSAVADGIEPDLIKLTEQERLTQIGKRTLRNREVFELARAMFDDSESTNKGEGDE